MKDDSSRRRPREQLEITSVRTEQPTMDDKRFCPSSTPLVQKFSLNSYSRVVARKGLDRKPTNSIVSSDTLQRLNGQKCNNLDLSVLSQSFVNYRKVVNLILENVFPDDGYLDILGKELEQSRGMVYQVLRKEQRLRWTSDNEFGQLVYERLHRNALETAARIIYAYYTRRRLVNGLLDILASDEKQLLRLMTNRRIPSDLIRRVKDTIDKKSKGSYHYALSACRQMKRVLSDKAREANPLEGERRRTIRELLETKSPDRLKTQTLIIDQVEEWRKKGFPFVTPSFKKDTMDFAASTEGNTGQGYWFQQDPKREDEIVVYIKTPPGIDGHDLDTDSPYKSQTVRLRFLNWFPRKAKRARRKAKEARKNGLIQRAIQLEYRAARFEDMSQQLVNTIQLHRFTRELARERALPEKNDIRINNLKTMIHNLKRSRRSAPPIIKVEGTQATISIPFMPPGEKLLKDTISTTKARKKRAGVDRGLRHSMVVSVKNGDDSYGETMIGRQDLFKNEKNLDKEPDY